MLLLALCLRIPEFKCKEEEELGEMAAAGQASWLSTI